MNKIIRILPFVLVGFVLFLPNFNSAQAYCSDTCAPYGETQCADSTHFQTCGYFEYDGCRTWSDAQSCGAGQTCQSGECVEEETYCSDECAPYGETQCSDSTHFQTCGYFEYDECRTWSNSQSCGAGQICQAGGCITEPDCTSHYEKRCYNGDSYWYDSCGHRETKYQDCDSIGKICQNGNCVNPPVGTLSVSLDVIPSSSECAPLNDVDLKATVSGTATGNIKYSFDCENDGEWDKTITTSTNPYTALDLCDYTSAGEYTAKVRVERANLTKETTAQISVDSRNEDDLSVTLDANPDSGCAKLKNVDLKATVSGSVTGSIKYYFDCENDGDWDKIFETDNNPYTATDLCDYTAKGTYTAKVKVERGGLTDTDTDEIKVTSTCGGGGGGGVTPGNSYISVDLDANPKSGCYPLNNVDLTATISTVLSGAATYYFDCENDGNWDEVVTKLAGSYTSEVCDYSRAGTYTAKVRVDKQGYAAENTAKINVSSSCGVLGASSIYLSVNKLVKNLSDGTAFVETVAADPGEVLLFSIQISSGSYSLRDLNVRDSLPANITLTPNSLKINGVAVSGDITKGINIGNMAANDTKTLTFEATVASADKFSFGENNLINTVIVYSTEASGSDIAKILVTRKSVAGAATGIATGLTNNIFVDSVVIPLAVALLLIWIFKTRILKFEEWFDARRKAYLTFKSDKVLKTKIMKTRLKEVLGRRIS